MLASTSSGSEMSQKGWAQIATPPASWIASIASRDGRRLAQAEGRLALDQVAADQRADVVDAPRPAGARRWRARRARPRRGAGGRSVCRRRCARSISRFVELEAELAQRVAHAQRALLAVGEELGEPFASAAGRCGRCRSRGCAVRAGTGEPVVDGGDLDGGDDPHAQALRRRRSPRRRRRSCRGRRARAARRRASAARCDDLGGAQHAVGVGRVRLQVEAEAHTRGAYAIASAHVWRGRRVGSPTGASSVGARSAAATRGPSGFAQARARRRGSGGPSR